ncbi:hypothetical protein OQH61_00075 [Helicobacter sp. MIT 21-1697]|uniref:hypothetical protein n=1 Tax=Helicobacter sp. MIT 21-1697 TaxID=2993733 RepID=UPI00224AD95A|nr:hypothetical protein [Helicobacter sp. MIT 21-1697]MCX2716136.1 hypothetical protein [Helicobacter sp. MIT 21-1697]
MSIVILGVIAVILLFLLYHSSLPNAKILFVALALILAIAIPPLGVFLVCVGIVYYFITSIQEAENGG